MTPKQIKDGAPNGATHYGSKGNYFKHNGIHWLIWKEDYKSWMGIFIIGELKLL